MCIGHHSNPPTNLSWYINGEPVRVNIWELKLKSESFFGRPMTCTFDGTQVPRRVHQSWGFLSHSPPIILSTTIIVCSSNVPLPSPDFIGKVRKSLYYRRSRNSRRLWPQETIYRSKKQVRFCKDFSNGVDGKTFDSPFFWKHGLVFFKRL